MNFFEEDETPGASGDGFTHRPWPRVPRLWGPRATPCYDDSLLKFGKLRRGITSQFTLKRAKMQMSKLYQNSKITIILFVTQYTNDNTAFHWSSAVSASGNRALESDVASYYCISRKLITSFAWRHEKKLCDRPVVLKVGEITPLGSILRGMNKTKVGDEQNKGGERGKTTQRGPKRSTTTANRSWVNFGCGINALKAKKPLVYS